MKYSGTGYDGDHHSELPGSVEGKNAPTSYSAVPTSPNSDLYNEVTIAWETNAGGQAKTPRRIQILRMVKSLLTAVLSLIIAIFQGKAYWTYLRTKDVPGAWPKTMNVLPTVLLFAIAVMAICSDVCIFTAYFCVNKQFAQRLVKIAGSAQSSLTTAKGMAYALTAVVCRGGFDFGNSSGTHTDLWSWSCADQTAEMDTITQAESNCNTQCAAWIIAILQAGIEFLGFLIEQNVSKAPYGGNTAA